MPSDNEKATMELKSQVFRDDYTGYVEKAFDLAISDFATTTIPDFKKNRLPADWKIGVICGASGSGKSTILRSLGEVKTPVFDNNKSVLSNFAPMPPEEATKLLASMGLASVPSWIRPFCTLSNGEQYRASIAKVVSENGLSLIDEYTSVVDRNVAKSMSNALAKYIRRGGAGKRVVLATCHYDLLDWLQPDWIFDLNKGGVLERGDYLQRPRVQLQVYRTTSDTWDLFKKHHYMTSQLNSNAQCLCFTWEDKLVAFASVMPLFGRGLANSVRFHRIVVLPDFQGLGIGRAITDFVSGIYKGIGKRVYIKTINPRLGEYFKISDKWKMTPHSEKFREDVAGSDLLTFKGHKSRSSYCAEYIGEPISGGEHLTLPIDVLRREKSLEGQLSLF